VAEYDAIVAGSGPNGLAAALRLAEAGWSVCVLEASERIGGGAATLESTLPGFKHDFGAGFFPMAPLSPALGGRDLAPYGLRLLHAPLAAAHPFPGNRAVALSTDLEETAASLDKAHPGDGAAWIELERDYGDALEAFLRAQMVRWPLAEALRLAGALGPSVGRAAGFARMLLQGAATVAERFASEEARAFLVGPAMHADLEPEMPGSGVYALILGLLGQRYGMPVAEGGSGAVSAALAARLRELGGTILTGRRVERIVVEGGRVLGVEAGDDAVAAGRAVIAALDPHKVIDLCGPDAFPVGAVEQVRRFRPGLGTFKVDWALDGPVPWAAEECRRAAVVHVGDTVTQMSRAAWEAGHGLLPARPTLILGQQSLADPSRAPAGKHTLWGYAHVPAHPAGDAARPRAKGDWERSAEPFLDRMEAAIEAHAPGFRELVLARKVWTPLDLEAADANLVGGDIQAGSFAVDQQLIFRPGPSWWRWGTPVKGLYLASAAVPPGAGVHGACGDQAACQALADQRRPRLLAAGAAAGAALLATRSLRSRARRRRGSAP
jgi:phytoene dehydrogenase-like protein